MQQNTNTRTHFATQDSHTTPFGNFMILKTKNFEVSSTGIEKYFVQEYFFCRQKYQIFIIFAVLRRDV